jgi:hypothetical protein
MLNNCLLLANMRLLEMGSKLINLQLDKKKKKSLFMNSLIVNNEKNKLINKIAKCLCEIQPKLLSIFIEEVLKNL